MKEETSWAQVCAMMALAYGAIKWLGKLGPAIISPILILGNFLIKKYKEKIDEIGKSIAVLFNKQQNHY